MYYPHFGLKEPPFKITPNTDFFFSGGNRGAILDALVYAIINGEGIIKVVGEVGSGKTMLCRMLQTILPEQIESIYLANPSVAPEDVLHAIAFELQLKLPKNADRLKVMQALQAHLLSRHAEGRQVVIFVEEAQGMPLATLEEIRLLSNLETKQDKLLQIVLFGQPELDENLNQEHIRQLRERITHRFNLGPLQTKDVGEYLIFRLRAAGYHGPHLFTDTAIKKLSNAAQGLVRRVNILADKALLAAFADNVYQVTPKHVKAAIDDSEFGVEKAWYHLGKPQQYALWVAVLLAVIVAAILMKPSISDWVPLVNSASKSSAAKMVVAEPSSGNQQRLSATQSTVAVEKTEKSIVDFPALTAPVTAALSPNTLDSDLTLDSNLTLVERRLEVTKNLLLNANPETITLQIKSLPSGQPLVDAAQDSLLQAELEKLGQQVEMDNIYLYRMLQNGALYTVILYGTYQQRGEALTSLKNLPENIKSNRPYLRTIAGIKKDTEL